MVLTDLALALRSCSFHKPRKYNEFEMILCAIWSRYFCTSTPTWCRFLFVKDAESILRASLLRWPQENSHSFWDERQNQTTSHAQIYVKLGSPFSTRLRAVNLSDVIVRTGRRAQLCGYASSFTGILNTGIAFHVKTTTAETNCSFCTATNWLADEVTAWICWESEIHLKVSHLWI